MSRAGRGSAVLGLWLLGFLLWGCGSSESAAERELIARAHPPLSAAEIQRNEQEVWRELNAVRHDPAAYARRYLVPRRGLYHDRLLRQPGKIDVLTDEGVRALEECIDVLTAASAAPPLTYSAGLARAAQDHVRDQSASGETGHEGSDGSAPVNRIERYGRWHTVVGENIAYGYGQARDIVIQLLVDDGVPDRGHRAAILNPSFRMVGVAIGPHPEYHYMCVMDFAAAYTERGRGKR